MKATQLKAHCCASILIGSSMLFTACGVAEGPGSLTLDSLNTNTQPKPDSEGISITAPLSFAIKEALDPLSVNSTNVHLMPGAGHSMDAGDDGAEEDMAMLSNDPIPGDVTYNEQTKTITFVPKVAMDQGRSYHIHASNLKLKGGKLLKTGLDTIKYGFITSHGHEYYRKEFDETGQIAEERYTDTTGNKRVQRKEFEYKAGVKTLDYTRHYGKQHSFPGMNPADESVYWQQDGPTQGVQRYEVKRKGSDNKEYTVRVRFNRDKGFPQTTDIATDPVHNIWTADAAHGTGGHHQISYQYEPVADRKTTDTPWPSSGNPTSDAAFELDDAQLMEMDHSKPTAGSTTQTAGFQHRHIFYGDLGSNGDIDFDSQGKPAPVDDRVRVYHTRDLSNYLRTHEWSWLGEDRRTQVKKFGADGVLFTNDDIAYRLRIYVYDDKGRRAQRVTFEVPREQRAQSPYGLTRDEWTQVLQQSGYKGHQLTAYGITSVSATQPAFTPNYNISTPNGVNVVVHSYRIYEYEVDSQTTDPTTFQPLVAAGGLKKVTVWHENSSDTALFKEQERFYTTQPTVTGETLAQSAF